MKTIRVKISSYNSEFFPVKITWNINKHVYYNVFSTEKEAINYVIGRFGAVTIKNNLKEG